MLYFEILVESWWKAGEKRTPNYDWHLKTEANKQMDKKVWNKSFADNHDNQMPPYVLVFYCLANEAIFDMRNIAFLLWQDCMPFYWRLLQYLVVKVLFFHYLVNSEKWIQQMTQMEIVWNKTVRTHLLY